MFDRPFEWGQQCQLEPGAAQLAIAAAANGGRQVVLTETLTPAVPKALKPPSVAPDAGDMRREVSALTKRVEEMECRIDRKLDSMAELLQRLVPSAQHS